MTADQYGNNYLLQNEMQGPTLSAKLTAQGHANLDYEYGVRYHLLTGSSNLDGSTFKASPGMLLDGQFGMSRRYSSGMDLGLFWLLQYQQFNYDLMFQGASSSGTQNLLNSNLQLRIGYDFLN